MPHISLDDLELRLTARDRDLSHLTAAEQFQILKSRSREMVDAQRLQTQLVKSQEDKRPLRIKYGVDPTGSEIHLGHIVPIIVARRLLQMGHRVTIVIGDFTAFVGDPSGRVSTRPILTTEQIAENVVAYKKQIGRFIDISRIEFINNSMFYDPGNMSLLDYFRILRGCSVAPLLQREDFRTRQQSGLTIAELLYPTLMAIDSIGLQTEIELGGIDQLLNFQITKTFMERQGLTPETAITTDLLQSTAGDGKKMSKSEGNFISLRATPEQVYGKILSIPDRLMEEYFKLLTDITDAEWADLTDQMASGLSPKVIKQLLARIIVTWMDGKSAARTAEVAFEKVFSKREVPSNIRTVNLVSNPNLTWIQGAVDLKLVSSRTTFRRLVESKTIKLRIGSDEHVLLNPDEVIPPGKHILRYGRGKYIALDVS